ncbi:hypothetical protein [Halorubrum yunnanense]|uniref:DUF8054 domain-containing protein n=1 Tax=Halorubrum yunnanense TaxID=1526162 RepID=A0ABD5YEP7_9EURY|nr:hypothetical protein [Halorubrum yunnanense]
MTGRSGGAERSGGDGSGEASDAPELRIPRGTLLRSRVVSDVATTLSRALERGLTGYATLVPQETLLLEGEARGVLTFADGVPVLAYNTVSDSGGSDALAELAVPGPYRVELYAVDDDGLATAHGEEALRVAPGATATELADDPSLADRTREAAPDERLADPDAEDADAVAAFLEDDDRIEAIREQAREEAAERADEWGLDGALGDETGGPEDEGVGTGVGGNDPVENDSQSNR